MISERIYKMGRTVTLEGWYETEFGLDPVHETGDSLTAIIHRLHKHDPDNFGLTDCEFTVIGNGYEKEITAQVVATVERMIS
jgi:hypothetical protein